MSTATDLPRTAVETRRSSTTRAIHQWLHESAGGQRRLDYAMSALEWCRRLPKLADMLPAAVWQELLDHLLQAGAETTTSAAGLLEADPVVHQLLAGELPLTLATLLPEIEACRRLLPAARRALSAGLVDLLDGKGLLHARHFDHVRPLLACWTRCHELGKRWKRGCCSAKADKQYRQFVRSALRLTRRDGSPVLSDEPPDPEAIALLTAALAMVGGEDDLAIASLVLSGNKKQFGGVADVRLPKAATHSEWAATAILRPDWSRSAPRLTVLYPDASCRVELACGKDVIWSGDWGFDVRIDGLPVAPVSEWSNTCWVSDKDVDYLELEIEVGEGLRIQRHFLMARKDGFLLLADAVLGSRPAALDYCGTLPLGRQITYHGAGETSEGVLAGRKARAVAIPLALPEWLADVSGNGGADIPVCPMESNEQGRQECPPHLNISVPLLETNSAVPAGCAQHGLFQAGPQTDDKCALELRQSAHGCSLFAPLFFDLNQRRFGKPLTWRQVTVAESLAVQPDDTAVGYRVSTGGRQWLIYRSLTPARNRTLLGHNLSSEMLVARFTRKGEVESLIEIE